MIIEKRVLSHDRNEGKRNSIAISNVIFQETFQPTKGTRRR